MCRNCLLRRVSLPLNISVSIRQRKGFRLRTNVCRECIPLENEILLQIDALTLNPWGQLSFDISIEIR